MTKYFAFCNLIHPSEEGILLVDKLLRSEKHYNKVTPHTVHNIQCIPKEAILLPLTLIYELYNSG